MKSANPLALVMAWLITGCVASLAGFLGLLYPITSIILILPITMILVCLWSFFSNFIQLKPIEKAATAGLIVLWLIHATGIFVPETGFDAVWYHLPVIKAFSEAHRFVYLPDLYQSLNPLFSDSIFLLGFQVAGDLGTKAIAYAFGLTLVIITYALSRAVLPRTWALGVTLLISTFQVVTWQASSFYIDVAKAVWELAAVWLVLKQKNIGLAGLFLGASVASKFFSIALIPVFAVLVVLSSNRDRLKKLVTLVVGMLVVAAPFYLRTYLFSGGELLTGKIFFDTIPTIGGQSQVGQYLLQRFIQLPSALWPLTTARDYTTILFLVCLPIIVWRFRAQWQSKSLRLFWLFTAGELLIWWFVPPLSTRYALAGFITLAILYFDAIAALAKKYPQFVQPMIVTIVLAIGINLVPRGFVAIRNMDYIVSKPPLPQYLSQFYDGWIDTPLKAWHNVQ